VKIEDIALKTRVPAHIDLSDNEFGMGRELFAPFRQIAGTADHGGSVLFR
jgi:phosphogluconate dehydratase